ncbi:MAG: site-specific integrase [Gemmatimonadota bacterium]
MAWATNPDLHLRIGTREPMSENSRAGRYSAVKAFLRDNLRPSQQIIVPPYISGMPRARPSTAMVEDPLQPWELQRMIGALEARALESPYRYMPGCLMLVLAAYTGARNSEIGEIRWRDLEPGDAVGFIRVRDSKLSAGEAAQRARYRYVPYWPALKRVLRWWREHPRTTYGTRVASIVPIREQGRARHEPAGLAIQALVDAGEIERMGISRVSGSWRTAANDAGIERARHPTPQSIRVMVTSLLEHVVRPGTTAHYTPSEIEALIGHTPATRDRYYKHEAFHARGVISTLDYAKWREPRARR